MEGKLPQNELCVIHICVLSLFVSSLYFFTIDKICFYSPDEYESNFHSPFISDVVSTHIQR